MSATGMVGHNDFLHLIPIFSFIPVFITVICVSVPYSLSFLGGWHLLAERFRAIVPFSGKMYRWVYATMLWGAHYNGALKAGANAEGLYIATLFLFRLGHPPLFIPWSEIKIGPSRWVDFYLSITLTLGGEEQIPFRISRRLARRFRNDAGASWPDPQNLLQL